MIFETSTINSTIKIFQVNRSELEDRIDPIYYNSVNDLDIVNTTNYPVFKLGKLVKLQRGRFGHRPRNDPKFFGGDYPFIQTGNIVEASKTNSKVGYSQTLNEMGLLTSRLFQPDTLVITIAANIGDTAIIDYPACFPDSLVSLIPKKDNINIYYLNHYIRFIKFYIENLAPQAAQKNINIKQLSAIPIVVPPTDIQTKIVAKLDNAYFQKQQKQSAAKSLLQSIDIYLLNELGITTPGKNRNLSGRIFTAAFSDVTGGRLDPKLYDKYTVQLKQSILDSPYPKLKLKSLIIQSINGNWGSDDAENVPDGYSRCIVIRATEFYNNGNLNLETSRVKYRLLSNALLKKMDIIEGDILIEKSGGSPDQPVGRVAIITNELLKNNKIAYSNFIQKVRIDTTKLIPEYLFYFLKMVYNAKLTDAMQSQTNGIRNLIMSNYYAQDIIIPPIEKQQEIVSRINNLFEKAKQLKEEASNIFQTAKEEIEKQILG